MTWKTVYRLLLSVWDDFSRRAKKGLLLNMFLSTIIFVQNWAYVGTTQERWCHLTWNSGKTKWKLASSKSGLSCLTLFPPSVHWDIMGYESETLPSYRYLSNRSYTIKFKNIFISGLLYLPSHIVIPPPHKNMSSQNPLLSSAQLIYEPKDHMCRNGGLTTLYILLDCTKTYGFHHLSHRGPLPLFARRMLFCYPCNNYGCPMTEYL